MPGDGGRDAGVGVQQRRHRRVDRRAIRSASSVEHRGSCRGRSRMPPLRVTIASRWRDRAPASPGRPSRRPARAAPRRARMPRPWPPPRPAANRRRERRRGVRAQLGRSLERVGRPPHARRAPPARRAAPIELGGDLLVRARSRRRRDARRASRATVCVGEGPMRPAAVRGRGGAVDDAAEERVGEPETAGRPVSSRPAASHALERRRSANTEVARAAAITGSSAAIEATPPRPASAPRPRCRRRRGGARRPRPARRRAPEGYRSERRRVRWSSDERRRQLEQRERVAERELEQRLGHRSRRGRRRRAERARRARPRPLERGAPRRCRREAAMRSPSGRAATSNAASDPLEPARRHRRGTRRKGGRASARHRRGSGAAGRAALDRIRPRKPAKIAKRSLTACSPRRQGERCGDRGRLRLRQIGEGSEHRGSELSERRKRQVSLRFDTGRAR